MSLFLMLQAASTAARQLSADVVTDVVGHHSVSQFVFDVGVIIALLIQTSFIARWLGEISRSVKEHDRRLDVLEKGINEKGSPVAAEALQTAERNQQEIERLRNTVESHSRSLVDNATQLAHFSELAADVFTMLKQIHGRLGATAEIAGRADRASIRHDSSIADMKTQLMGRRRDFDDDEE